MTTYEYNSLHYYAKQLHDTLTEQKDLEELDRTQLFYNELNTMIIKGEIIIIQINSKMRLGKSTLALSIGHHIYGLLQKHKKTLDNRPFGLHNIAMDQMEFDLKMRKPETTFTVIVTDEENKSEDTGQDITTIRALQEDQSNIQADRYVHRVSASPTGLTDPNTDIILDVVSQNEDTKTIRANITYRWYEELTEKTQMIGYVIIPVGHVIHNWIKTVKPLFYKKLQLEALNTPTKTQQKELQNIQHTIKHWEQNDWYIHYYMKKRRKIELVTKYKIQKTRLIRYAPAILNVIQRFQPLTQHYTLIKKDMIKNNLRTEMKKLGMPQSIIGQELTTQEVLGVLDAYIAFHKLNTEINKLYKQHQKGNIEDFHYSQQKERLESLKTIFMQEANEQKQEYENAIRLLEEYEAEYKEEPQ